MISTDFAPNETWNDAWFSLKMIFQPWNWKQGKYSSLVKKKLKQWFNNYETILFFTGRAALYHLLKSLNLPPDSQILVQGFTCEAVILPILANRLKPVYVDIEPKTFSMNLINLEKKYTEKAKVLVLQHTFGLLPQNRDKILQFAKDHHLFVIEDLAHGFSPDFIFPNNTFLLSFGRSKALSSVFGSAIITKNKRLADNLKTIERQLINPDYVFILRCLLYKLLAMIIKSSYDLYLGKIIHKISKVFHILPPEITSREKRGEFDQINNKAFPNALAYLLYQQLKKFDRMQKQRAKICEIYNSSFKQTLTAPLIRYPILMSNRNQLLKYFANKNIYLGKWYDQVIAPKELDLKKLFYQSGSCPKAESICEKIVNLPTLIAKKQAENIVRILKQKW